MILNGEIIIFDFEKNTNINRWYSTNDDVMGGISNSVMNLDENGNGVFTGVVSTENNGGFAMVRLPLNINLSDDLKNIVLHVKGDGKKYQLRMKSNRSQ
jgi:NADH dehydrogenase [ubiquinone] 1 alpha subcomplex assembly factor 1